MTSQRSVVVSSCATDGRSLSTARAALLKMPSLTYYVVLPFFRTTGGTLVADEPIEVPDASRARRQAERVARSIGGAVAFSRTGHPTLGEYQDAVVLARFGDVPGVHPVWPDRRLVWFKHSRRGTLGVRGTAVLSAGERCCSPRSSPAEAAARSRRRAAG